MGVLSDKTSDQVQVSEAGIKLFLYMYGWKRTINQITVNNYIIMIFILWNI